MSAALALEPEVAQAKPRRSVTPSARTWALKGTVPEMVAQLPDAEVIPLPVVRDLIGWTRDQQVIAVREGVIHPLPKKGKAGCYQVTRDDAIEILIAAALAFAAGVAVVAMLRGLQGTGLNASVLASAVT